MYMQLLPRCNRLPYSGTKAAAADSSNPREQGHSRVSNRGCHCSHHQLGFSSPFYTWLLVPWEVPTYQFVLVTN